jgi:hypothetical protein
MSRSLLLASFAALIVVAAPRAAAACSCVMPPPPKQALADSSAVFEGKILRVDHTPEKHRLMARFAVSRWWKGGGSAETSVATIDIGSMCGLAFAVGEEWLIYASGADDGLSTGLCTRTKKSADAGADRKALGAGKPADPNKPSPTPAADPPAEPAPEPAPAEPAPSPAPLKPPAPVAPPAVPAEPAPAATQGCSLAPRSGGLAWVMLMALAVRRRR